MANELRIAICDDHDFILKDLLRKIHGFFSKQGFKLDIDGFADGKSLIKSNVKKQYQLLFLDIQMPGITGFEVAQIVNSSTNEIVFVTNEETLIFKSIEFKPFAFVRKNHLENDLGNCLDRLIKAIKDNELEVAIKNSDGETKVSVRDIMYINSDGHYLNFHLRNRKIRIRGNLYTWEQSLENQKFIKINSGAIVNYQYVLKLEDGMAQLINGDNLVISRRKVKDVRHLLSKYRAEEYM